MAITYDVIVRGNNLAFRGGYFALANVTLVFTPDGPVLFDTGHYCNRPSLLDGLARHGLAPKDVRAVFLSHLHFDHCNNIDLFGDAKVYVSKREWAYVDAPHEKDMFVPWMVREQLKTHDVEFLDGEGRIAEGVRYFPAPGHTPGSYALDLDTANGERVVLAGDAIKYAKEAVTKRCDMAFDTIESGTASIEHILTIADRIVPGHFPELIKRDGTWIWEEAAELALLVR
jgi:glyoxylase-like metal-dependent hydrolase (beta-lactamase superfamily II)